MNGNQLSAEASKYYTKIPTGEKVAYGFWGFGSDLVWQTVSLYLTFYYTDIFGISAAQVTLLFLVSRIWDAINDPLMGIIIDKVHLKNKNNYKYIPWFQRLVIPFGIVTVLVFTTPVGISKIAFAWFTYIVFGMLFTAVSIPVISLSSAMTQDPIERTKLNSFCLFCSGIGGVSCSVLVPFLSERLGTTPQTGYQRTMIVISIIMVISYLTTSFFCKERVPEVKTNDSEGSLTLSDVLEMFKKNRPLLILIAMYLAAYTFNIVISSVGTYFVTYNLEGKISVGIWSLLQTLPSIIPMLFVPALAAKVGKKMVVQTGGIIGIIGAAIVYVMPSASLVGLCIGKGIGALGYGMAIAAIWSTMPDTVEYGEYVIGKRAGGLIFSLATFSIKRRKEANKV